MSDFTVAELKSALEGSGEGYTKVVFEISDSYKNASWVEDGGTTSQWCAKKDENGFPVVKEIVVVSPDDEGYDEREAEDIRSEYVDEFWYEGGYVHPYGYFKMLDNGNLGDGHEAWALVEHQGSGRLFRASGYYSSWDGGTDLDDGIVEVVPAEVKVVRYRPIDQPDAKPFEYPAVNA